MPSSKGPTDNRRAARLVGSRGREALPQDAMTARCVTCGLPDRGHDDSHGFHPAPAQSVPSEEWQAHGLAAVDHLDDLWRAGEPGGIGSSDWNAAIDAIRAALRYPVPALDVERLARAIEDHDDICSRMAIPECAPAIAARYAALAPEPKPETPAWTMTTGSGEAASTSAALRMTTRTMDAAEAYFAAIERLGHPGPSGAYADLVAAVRADRAALGKALG